MMLWLVMIPMAWSNRTRYQGKPVNKGTLAILNAANKLVRSSYFGKETSNITLVQGGYNRGGVAASAGTHDGGGAIDITAHNWRNREKVFRLLGVAMWDRPTLPGVWSHHMHGIVCGDGTASAGAKRQVTAYYKRRNGLANNGADRGYRMLVFPLFVDPEKSVGKPGVKYLTKDYTSREQPTTKSKSRGAIKKDAKFTVVAVVNVNGTYWSINVDGRFVPSSILTSTEPNPLPATTPLDAVWRVTRDGKWGYDGPNGSKKYERKKHYKLYTVATATVNGTRWYVTKHGTWYDSSHLIAWEDLESHIKPLEATWRVTKDGKWGYEVPGGSKLYERAQGYKLVTVSQAIIQGTQWYITRHDTWYTADDLEPWDDGPKPTSESLEYRVDADPFLWGLEKPGSGNVKKTQRPNGSTMTSQARIELSNGETWIQGTDGFWSHAGYLVPTGPVPVPDDKTYVVHANPFLWALAEPGSGNEKKAQRPNGSTIKAQASITLDNGETWVQATDGYWSHAGYLKASDFVTVNIGIINVVRWRLGSKNERGVGSFKVGLPWEKRLPGFAEMQKQMRSSVIGTVESGTYNDGAAFSRALGWGGVRSGTGDSPDFVLHGDDAGDITNAVHWHPKREMLKSGKIKTGDSKESGNHNCGTWALLRDVRTGIIFIVPCHHAYWPDRGKDKATAADKIREKHTKVLIAESEKLAKKFAQEYGVNNVPIVFVGDFNQDKDDFYDGPGRAMKAAGYVDAETLTTNTGPSNTYPNIPPHKPSHRRFDRIFVKKGTVVNSMTTVYGPPYTDHNGVSISVNLSNS